MVGFREAPLEAGITTRWRECLDEMGHRPTAWLHCHLRGRVHGACLCSSSGSLWHCVHPPARRVAGANRQAVPAKSTGGVDSGGAGAGTACALCHPLLPAVLLPVAAAELRLGHARSAKCLRPHSAQVDCAAGLGREPQQLPHRGPLPPYPAGAVSQRGHLSKSQSAKELCSLRRALLPCHAGLLAGGALLVLHVGAAVCLQHR
mmetsp:Transcript_19109/g.53263  ORF Transcript_19109/g.53263 Transcript_19109/m.53263 type:complete len:204 (-) Transcript_19109:469-1080(-)